MTGRPANEALQNRRREPGEYILHLKKADDRTTVMPSPELPRQPLGKKPWSKYVINLVHYTKYTPSRLQNSVGKQGEKGGTYAIHTETYARQTEVQRCQIQNSNCLSRGMVEKHQRTTTRLRTHLQQLVYIPINVSIYTRTGTRLQAGFIPLS